MTGGAGTADGTGPGSDARPERSTTASDVDAAVREAVEAGADAGEVARRVAERPGVTHAEVLPGLVKTLHPLVEVDVRYTTPEGRTEGRVYDLERAVDGSLTYGHAHEAEEPRPDS